MTTSTKTPTSAPAPTSSAAPAAASAATAAAAATSPSYPVPTFFEPSVSLAALPQWLAQHYLTTRAELVAYDQLILHKVKDFAHKLRDIEVVLGIPFYTEITNIISVLVTLKEVFQKRKQRACIVVVGEFARSDMVEMIPIHQLVDAPEDFDSPSEQPESFVSFHSFWKPHPKYASKPFTVRALQQIANSANDGNGAHLIIMDADIQFNHWELSALSLMRALLDPLTNMKEKDHHTHVSSKQDQVLHPQYPLTDLVPPPAASFVLMNAPRSFLSDDALMHLFSYLLTYAYTGQHIHQSHGGEFSIHRRLNAKLLKDESISYRQCYCVEAQSVVRAMLEAPPQQHHGTESAVSADYGGQVVEMLMKGKWHAKINLNKLLQIDSAGGARIDFITEHIFQDALVFAAAQKPVSRSTCKVVLGGLTKKQSPDPNDQQMAVMCPAATKKEIMASIKTYYATLITQQSDGSLPIESPIVQELVPMLHVKIASLPGDQGWRNVKIANDGQLSTVEFGPDTWARFTMELLRLYHSSGTKEKQRIAVINANRIVWLLGALAFLNHNASVTWGAMHEHMHRVYAPVFRRHYLKTMCSWSDEQIAAQIAAEEPALGYKM